MTVVVRSDSGVLFEMDVPTGVLALERYEQAIASGRLVVVDTPVKWVDGPEGSKFLVDVEPEPAAEARKRGRKPADAESPEPAPEPTPGPDA